MPIGSHSFPSNRHCWFSIEMPLYNFSGKQNYWLLSNQFHLQKHWKVNSPRACPGKGLQSLEAVIARWSPSLLTHSDSRRFGRISLVHCSRQGRDPCTQANCEMKNRIFLSTGIYRNRSYRIFLATALAFHWKSFNNLLIRPTKLLFWRKMTWRNKIQKATGFSTGLSVTRVALFPF
jgi:hypothetical protein